MKKLIFILLIFIAASLAGCIGEKDKANPNIPPLSSPIINDDNEGNSNNDENRLNISPEAMEVLAKIVGIPLEELTWEDLQNIRFFYIDREIKDIDNALKALENLEELHIYVPIDFSILPELKSLKNLYIQDFKSTDLEYLKELEQLEHLTLSNGSISDFSFLSRLKHLHTLHLYYTGTSDFSQFPVMENLRNLHVHEFYIPNLDAINNFPNLESL